MRLSVAFGGGGGGVAQERLEGRTVSDETIKKESMYINQSLSYLEQCVVALSRRSPGHIPYRQSKLTNVLKVKHVVVPEMDALTKTRPGPTYDMLVCLGKTCFVYAGEIGFSPLSYCCTSLLLHDDDFALPQRI